MSTLTTAQKSQIDRLWTEFWTGGITNPLTVIEQISFLMFIAPARRERDAQREARRAHEASPSRARVFSEKHRARCAGGTSSSSDGLEMLRVVRDEVFPHLRRDARRDERSRST
jgi:type I restriction enzyme M protein